MPIQLKWGDKRGFKTYGEALLASRGTTYKCAYKAMEFKKAMMDTHLRERYLSRERFFADRKNHRTVSCPAYRADCLDKAGRFMKCHAIAAVDDDGHLECPECLFTAEYTKTELKELFRDKEPL